MCVSAGVIEEIRRIIKTSEIMKYVLRWKGMRRTTTLTPHIGKTTPNGRRRIRMDGKNWRSGLETSISPSRFDFPNPHLPYPDLLGRATIDVCVEGWANTTLEQTAKIGSLVDVTESADPEGLRVFYYLVQDLKALVFSLIALHFKIKPI